MISAIGDFPSLNLMKDISVECRAAEYSYGRKANLDEHFQMLYREFAGRPLVLYYHAFLIVMLRRGMDTHGMWCKFWELWTAEKEFLCCHLDSRWLVSACDTVIDHSDDPGEVAYASTGTLFANTVKLYETERFCLGRDGPCTDYRPVTDRIPIYDGMSAFAVGHGDMIANLANRIRRLRDRCVMSRVACELLERTCRHDTVFARFRRVHRQNETAW